MPTTVPDLTKKTLFSVFLKVYLCESVAWLKSDIEQHTTDTLQSSIQSQIDNYTQVQRHPVCFSNVWINNLIYYYTFLLYKHDAITS